MLRTDKPWHVTEDQYKLAAELNEAVPPAQHRGDDLLMWYPAHDLLASGLAAQFLWSPNALRAHLPTLTTPDVKLINQRRPTTLLLMGTRDTGFDEAVSELSQAGAPMNVTSTDTLKAGRYTFHVWVLTSAFLRREAGLAPRRHSNQVDSCTMWGAGFRRINLTGGTSAGPRLRT